MPRRENDQTREAERRIMDAVASKWGYRAHKLPMKYYIDFLISKDGRAVAWAEVKQRHNKRDQYETYNVSLHKYMRLVDLGQQTGLRSLMLVGWEDGIGWVAVPCKHSVVWSGRTDRGDEGDVEPMVSIPVRDFRMV